jgi:hypothetical protein
VEEGGGAFVGGEGAGDEEVLGLEGGDEGVLGDWLDTWQPSARGKL